MYHVEQIPNPSQRREKTPQEIHFGKSLNFTNHGKYWESEKTSRRFARVNKLLDNVSAYDIDPAEECLTTTIVGNIVGADII